MSLIPRSFLAPALAAICAAALFPQSRSTADAGGTVTDATDAVIAIAKVTLTATATGAARETATGPDGSYRFTLVPPGEYDIKVEAPGFTPQVKRGVTLTVGASADIDFKVSVGASQQLVEVNSDLPIVETERTQQANTLGEESIRNLPINRRDYLTFSLLAPGVSDSRGLADSNSFRVKQTPDSGLSFYGSNGRGNNVSVDGGEANDSGGGVRPTVSQEAVLEFQVNRANYAAEHGAARGGVVNIVTKSGGNAVHGSGFLFLRNQGLDASDVFAIDLVGDRLQRIKPDSNRQQYGFTVGGPVVKDRTFYFFAFEGLRRRESKAVPVLLDPSIFLPTAAQENVLKGLPAAAAAQLRGALTASPATVALFKSNSGVFPFASNDYKGLLRVDHRVNERNQISFRYNVTKSDDANEGVGALVGLSRGTQQEYLDSTALLNWYHTFSPNMINEFRGQFNYYDALTASNDLYGPALEIAGFGFFNRDRFLPSNTITRREEIGDNLTINRGKHSFKIGGSAIIRNNRSFSTTFMSGRFTFGTLPASFVNPALASVTLTALQGFNLGLAQSYQQGFGDAVVKATYPLYSVYAQDTYRPTSRLTLNYGLRYEVDNRKDPLPTYKKAFAPRVGFAWDPFGDKKTTVRGGYGIFYTPVDFQIDYVVNALNEINGFRQIAQVLTTLNAANPLAVNGPVNIFQKLSAQGIIGIPTPKRSILATDLTQFGINISQTGPRPPLTVLFRADPNYRNPMAQQASFGIEREIAPNLSLNVSYVFVRGLHLTTSRDINLLPAPINPAKGIRDWGATADNPTGTKYFRDPLLFQENNYESGANSFYHGLLVEATKRFNRTASVHFNYTFAKAIDETTDYNSDFQPNDQTSRRLERSLSSFDQRHKVVLYAILNSGARHNAVLSNWAWTPIFRYNSARPFNLLAGAEQNNDRHNTTDRPIFAGRNTGIGPSFATFDMRISRRFRITEKTSLDAMAEAFNLPNKLNYGSVNNTVGAIAGPFNLSGRDDQLPTQPLGFTSAYDARRMQIGFRYSF